jgi:hypothetical protein
VALTDIVSTSTMGKPSKARGGGGSRLGGKSAAPVGTSGRAKSLRNGAVNRREKVDEHIPASLVTSSDESDEDESESDEDDEEGSGQEGSEEGGGEGEEESEEEEEISIAVPVAMWVSSSSSQVRTSPDITSYLAGLQPLRPETMFRQKTRPTRPDNIPQSRPALPRLRHNVRLKCSPYSSYKPHSDNNPPS